MKLKDITLSYPAIQYSINVSHFTSRHSTAIEWLILEVIQKAMENPHLEDVSIASVFEQIFLINDANLLIKPCILSLRDGGALIIENIYDEADLKEVPMRNLRLTEEGMRMQRDGLLPGKVSEDSLTITFDPIRQNLLAGNVNESYSDKATGIFVRELDTPGDISFPSALVMDYLETAKQNQRYKWITPTTEIHEVVPTNARVLWKNISTKLQVTANWKCYIDGDDDGSLAAKFLSHMAMELPATILDVLEIGELDPDTDINNLIELTALSGYLNSQVRQDAFFIIDQSHFSQDVWTMPGCKVKGLRVAIVEGAENTSVSLSGNRLKVCIPDHLLDDGVLYRSEKTTVKIGLVHLNAAETTKDAIFAFVPVDNIHEPLTSVVYGVVDKYSVEYPQMLYLLLENSEKNRFYDAVKDAVRRLDSLEARQVFLEAINRDGLQIYNKKLLSQDQYSAMLIDEDKIKAQISNFNDLERVISEYSNIQVIRSNDELLRSVVRTALESKTEPQSIDELWHLWKHLQSVKKSLLSWINSSKLYVQYYTPEIIEQIAKVVSFSEDSAIEGFTPVEAAFLDVERTVRRVLEKLPELDLCTNYSSEQVLESILMHRVLIAPLYSEIRNWDDSILSFEARVCSIEDVENTNPNIHTATVLMDRLRNALAIFFDESAVKFQRVFVVDTCALMNMPELISTFADGKSLLIVPVLVQNELDGQKENENEKIAFQAREAIRQIEKYRDADWLDNTQNSCPELLSHDLDPNRNDNKILSIGIKYVYKNATLITDDINLRNLASSQNVKSMDTDGYMKSKAHESSGETNKKKKKKKKG